MSDQLTQADLDGMTPNQIVEAKTAGQLDLMLGTSPDDVDLLTRARDTTGTLDTGDVQRLFTLHQYDLITAARQQGRITIEGN